MPAGRPSDYSQETADYICGQLALGRSMRRVCEDDGVPVISTVFRWLRQYPEFRQQYDTAKAECADYLADEIVEIADDGTNDYVTKKNKDGSEYEAVNSEHIQRSRLRVDARKWVAAKLKPKKYGDKVSQELSGPDGGPVHVKSEWQVLPVTPIDQIDETNTES